MYSVGDYVINEYGGIYKLYKIEDNNMAQATVIKIPHTIRGDIVHTAGQRVTPHNLHQFFWKPYKTAPSRRLPRWW